MHRTNRLSCTILSLATALAGCGGEGPPEGALAPDEPGEERAAAVVGGQSDQGHPAVGMLLTTDGDLCTGTLIAKRCSRPGTAA